VARGGLERLPARNPHGHRGRCATLRDPVRVKAFRGLLGVALADSAIASSSIFFDSRSSCGGVEQPVSRTDTITGQAERSVDNVSGRP